MNHTAFTTGGFPFGHRAYGSMQGSPEIASLGVSLLNSAADRYQANLNRLIRIKENIERHARKDVEKMHRMVDRRERKEV